MLNRYIDAVMPFQRWCPFSPEAIVLVKNMMGEGKIDLVKNLWWGWEGSPRGSMCPTEGVIIWAKRLDKPKK